MGAFGNQWQRVCAKPIVMRYGPVIETELLKEEMDYEESINAGYLVPHSVRGL